MMNQANPTETVTNPFRAGLLQNKKMIGFWCMAASNVVTEVLSGAGFDWLLIDAEHSTNDLNSLVVQSQVMKGGTTQCVVRPPWNDFVMIKRLMDCGFSNFLIPMVQSEEEARAAVDATRYPPDGIRGVSTFSRANDYGNVKGYHDTANQNIGLTIQVETKKTLDELEKICSVDGVDGIFLGPQDFAASLGHMLNPGHPEVQEGIKHVVDVANAHGKAAGILTPNEDDARRYIEWGYSFVAVGVDLGLLKSTASSLAARFKGSD
jgi:2-dehydro-3-deoxyglucarate aldolase